LSLPLDIQAAELAAPDAAATLLTSDPVRPSADSVAALQVAIEAAERPVFVAGRGGRAAGARIAELAARTGALVATSAVANGLFRGDDFDLGI
ncbi:thiamine pyrophosphate-binding protein, partial [Streptomyces sp. SID10244]|nr:thiamine pyrophosphate-binding protein [Streptomyces sp. SID10244]